MEIEDYCSDLYRARTKIEMFEFQIPKLEKKIVELTDNHEKVTHKFDKTVSELKCTSERLADCECKFHTAKKELQHEHSECEKLIEDNKHKTVVITDLEEL